MFLPAYGLVGKLSQCIFPGVLLLEVVRTG